MPRAFERWPTATIFVFGPKQLFKFLKLQLAPIVDRRNAQFCAFLFAQQLPRHNIRVMLHGSNQDLVATADVLATIGLCHQVDGFRGAAHKDDLFLVGGIQELLRGHADFFIRLGRAF